MERLKRAFTLIELMVVVAIISLLTSFLLAAVAGARNKVYQTNCMSNLRQIGVGLSGYTDNFDGYSSPAQLPPPYGHFLNYLYVEELEENTALLRCPSVQETDSFNPYGGEGAYGDLKKASYIMNVIREKGVAGWSYVGARISVPYPNAFGWCGDSITTPVRRNHVKRPTAKIHITDSSPGLTNSATALGILRLHETDHGLIDSNANSVVNAGERQIGYQHGLGFSALFGDLHGESRKSSLHEEWNAIQK